MAGTLTCPMVADIIRRMDFDIGPLLESWEYQPGQIVARKFVGKDGKEKIQLRVDVGILQMNADGRPDGKRPMGCASLYDHYQVRLRQYVARHEGTTHSSGWGRKIAPRCTLKPCSIISVCFAF